MPQSLARIHIHLVFSTKNRRPFLSEAIRPALHAYMASVLMNRACPPLALGSVKDHIQFSSFCPELSP